MGIVPNSRRMLSPYLLVLAAVLLYGVQAPLAKVLLEGAEPIPVSALLYLGAGLGIYGFRLLLRLGGIRHEEARLAWRDWPWLLPSILIGGVLAPILLMTGLRQTPAATASLLLNFEGAATALLGAWVFGEAIGRRTWWAVGLLAAGSVLLSLQLGAVWGFSLGALAILAACLLWGTDNHLARYLSAKDPLSLVSFRGVVAGSLTLLLAFLFGQKLPGWPVILGGLGLGFISYGLALALFVRAMRDLGATRATAFFSLSPFVGALLSFAIFREMPGLLFFVSLPFMVAGAYLLTSEQHIHRHGHQASAHEHRHHHDDNHHLHPHPVGEPPPHSAHSHWHSHAALTHEHPHTPDLHHRHRHFRGFSAPTYKDRLPVEEGDSQPKKEKVEEG